MDNHGLMRMSEFFDHVSQDYDQVHTSHIDQGKEYYLAISAPVVATTIPIAASNIGCGTELELDNG